VKNLFILLSLLLITGCSTLNKEKVVVTDTKVIYRVLPDNLVNPCVPDKPKTKEEYLALPIYERETYLTNYSISLLKTIKNCNLQLDELRILNNDSKSKN